MGHPIDACLHFLGIFELRVVRGDGPFHECEGLRDAGKRIVNLVRHSSGDLGEGGQFFHLHATLL